MKPHKTESDSTNATPSRTMSNTELTMWFAFANAMKFVNIGEDIYKQDVPEHDIPYKAIYNYVQTVSGDIRVCLDANGGIPMKYALFSDTDESRNVEEIDYHIR